ncbi:MAG: DUF3883 domain-containing protein [Chitinophagaceae bacterium]
MSKKIYIENLFQKRATFSDPDQAQMMSNLLDTVSTDIYSESQRFVFELIQNADDAAKETNNEVYFEFLPNFLIVSHNGKSFDEADITSLTGAGSSTKRSDSMKTGYKGIGFKSVFGKSEKVTIISDGYQFRFDKKFHQSTLPWQIIPIWTELTELDLGIQTNLLRTNYAVSTIIEIKNSSALKKDLEELLADGHILLFLRRVSKISISQNGKKLYSVEKKINIESLHYNQADLLKDGEVISSWILKTFDSIRVPENTKKELKQDEKTPEKLKNAEFTEISFAARVEGKKIRPLKKEESLIFTYLPTKVSDFTFPFLVNGSFMTNAAREAIHEDRVWNQWLFELVAEKIFEWLVDLTKTEFKYQILYLLPHRFNSLHNDLKKSFDSSFSHSSKRAFVTTSNENIKTPSAVILDKTGLSSQSFIDPKSIVEFLKIEKKLTFSDDCFVSPLVEESNKLKSVGVETFELTNFETFFSSPVFTRRHRVSDNFSLIQYFKDKSDNDKQGIWFQTLQTLSFIYDEKVLLKNPNNGICFPTGIPSTELGEIPVIHSQVFVDIQKDNSIYDWLTKLGVKEPSQVSYVTNVLIPNLKKTDFINNTNFLHITHYLFRLFKENLLNEETLELLRELPLKTTKSELTFADAQHCFLSNKYQPQLPIEGIIKNVLFVSEEYLFSGSNELEWNLFFRAIKVKDRVEIEIINNNNSLPTLRMITSPGWVDICSQKAKEVPGAFGFGEHNVIKNVRIPTFLNIISNNYDYCKLFWKNLFRNGISPFDILVLARFCYGIGYGKNSYSQEVENYFPWFVKHNACIPTSTGEILEPGAVFVNDREIKQIADEYLPVFDYEEPLSDAWKDTLKLKGKLELADYLVILTKMAEQSEKEDTKINVSVRRIGLIYSKLTGLLADMTKDTKREISTWATQNKLLCRNGKFEKAIELKWITVDGFSLESETLKVIELPDTTDKKSNSFRELIGLMGIQIIDKFIPSFDQIISDGSLKSKLESILPYYVALIEKKKLENKVEEFERLYKILDTTDFFSASKIKLSFNYQSEVYEGPTLMVYKEENKFYYKGKWQSERTLLSLIRELSSLMNITGLNEELRFLLLETEKSEIQGWLLEQGINIAQIIPIRLFSKKVLPSQGAQLTESTEVHKLNLEVNLDAQPAQQRIENAFNPTFTPDNIDVTKVSANKKIFTNSHAKAEANYSLIQNQEIREDVGKWSETFVNNYLMKQSANFTYVEWLNKDAESGKPYDFEVLENGKRRYIDVKGTPSGVKDIVYLSPGEWAFMFEKVESYSIYRVYDAGNRDARIEIIDNPALLLKEGKIFPNPITLQI